MNKKNKHIAGFTLVELLVGIVLSSLFIGGISQAFTQTTQSFRTQKTISNMVEDARFVLDILNKETRRTGYLLNRLQLNGDANTIFHNRIAIDRSGSGTYSIRNDGIATPGNVLTMAAAEKVQGGANAGTTNSPSSDSIIIRYQLNSGAEIGGNTYSSCTQGLALGGGEADTDRHIITIVFYMKKNTTVGSNVLYCRAARENLDTNDFILVNSKPLISNVERFRVLYAESDGANTFYVASDQVVNWADVRAARLSIVLKSEEENITSADSTNYLINGKLSIAPLQPAEKRLYRIFSTTILFRNNGS